MTAQGTTSAPAIPPAPGRAGQATGATQTQQQAQQAADQARAAAQAAADAVNQVVRDQSAGQPQIIIPPPYRDSRNEIPPEVIPLVGMIGGMLMTVILGYPIIRFIIRMIERKTDTGAIRAKDVTAQIRALQDSIDTMAIELERISEGQRFTAKLMAEREAKVLAQGDGPSR